MAEPHNYKKKIYIDCKLNGWELSDGVYESVDNGNVTTAEYIQQYHIFTLYLLPNNESVLTANFSIPVIHKQGYISPEEQQKQYLESVKKGLRFKKPLRMPGR